MHILVPVGEREREAVFGDVFYRLIYTVFYLGVAFRVLALDVVHKIFALVCG